MKKHTLLFFLLYIGLSCVSLANNKADSLLLVIREAEADTVKIVAYQKLGVYYSRINRDSALFYSGKAIDLAAKSKDKMQLALAYRQYGFIAQSISDFPLSRKYYQKALETHQKIENLKGVSELYNDIAITYYYEGNYSSASTYFEKSGILSLQIGDSIGAAKSYNNTGIMNDIAGKPKDALTLYLKALNIYEQTRDTNMFIGTYTNIALIYVGQKNYEEALKIYYKQRDLAKLSGRKKEFGVALSNSSACLDNLGRFDEARKNLQEALEIFIFLGDQHLIAQCYSNLSSTYTFTKENDKALDYALKSLAIKKELGSTGKLAPSLITIGQIYEEKGEYSKSVKYYDEALENATKTGYSEYIRLAHRGLSQSYKGLRNFEKAFYHLSHYVVANDSITSQENREIISELEKRFESEKKEQEILLLNKENELKDVELLKTNEANKRKSIQLYASVAIGIILFGLVMVVIRSNMQKKKTNNLLQQKNNEIVRQKNILQIQHTEITDSINYAKRIQEAILPSRYSLAEKLEKGFVLFKPKDIVSGDFYWLESYVPTGFGASDSERNITLFAAADCTGHGVPGAMVSVVCSNALSKALLEEGISNPGKLLDRTRELVIERFAKSEEEVKDGMDISLCALQGNTLSWSGANNPLWIIADENRTDLSGFKNLTGLESVNDKALYEIKPNKQPIGKVDNPQPFTTHTFELQEGDTIYIFTDGYQDQFGGPKGKKFKASQLKELLLSIQLRTLDEQKLFLQKAFENWKGDMEQVDDICIIGVRI